tara:strand:- start:354 stop:830 length:477 start_codon:yes stop_codon:yes gene_type:complete
MKITKQQLKQIIMEVIANEDEDPVGGLKGAFSGGKFDVEAFLDTNYPDELKALRKKGLLDRFKKAVKVAYKKEGKMLPPGQYLKQPDKLDAYLGLSSAPEPKQASKPSGGKAEVTNKVDRMYKYLRKLDAKFQKDPDIRKKYEAALAAVNAFNNAIRK